MAGFSILRHRWLKVPDDICACGMARVFDRYVTDRTLYAVQDEVRGERRGLWADHEPVPPRAPERGNMQQAA
jgi:hypothetical protein